MSRREKHVRALEKYLSKRCQVLCVEYKSTLVPKLYAEIEDNFAQEMYATKVRDMIFHINHLTQQELLLFLETPSFIWSKDKPKKSTNLSSYVITKPIAQWKHQS